MTKPSKSTKSTGPTRECSCGRSIRGNAGWSLHAKVCLPLNRELLEAAELELERASSLMAGGLESRVDELRETVARLEAEAGTVTTASGWTYTPEPAEVDPATLARYDAEVAAEALEVARTIPERIVERRLEAARAEDDLHEELVAAKALELKVREGRCPECCAELEPAAPGSSYRRCSTPACSVIAHHVPSQEVTK